MKNEIGILGLGVRSTNFYTNLIHKKFLEKYGEYHTFPFLMYQVDFNILNPYLPNQFEKLQPVLESCLLKMQKLPVNKWLIPNITLHETFDKLNSKIPVFHPLKLSVNFCKTHKIKKVVIFGTQYSMTSNYLKSNFEEEKIVVNQVSNEDLKKIDLLRTKIYNHSETEKEIIQFSNILQKYTTESHVIIACTELSLLTQKINSEKIIDMALLQINEVLKSKIN